MEVQEPGKTPPQGSPPPSAGEACVVKLSWRQETSILIPPGPRSSGGLRLLTAHSWASVSLAVRLSVGLTSFLRLLLQQGLANSSKQVESWFCRKRSLERGPALSLLYLCLWLLSCYKGRLEELRQGPYGPRTENIYYLVLHGESLCF